MCRPLYLDGTWTWKDSHRTCLDGNSERGERAFSSSRYLSGGGGGGGLSRGLNGLLRGLVGGSSLGEGSVTTLGGGIVLLAGGVDRDLNGDLTALDLLAVHLGASLLLELLRAKGDETEATALAGLTASLELLDHEARNGAEGDLGLSGRVVLEDLEELKKSVRDRNESLLV
jgi:hypothetical protein